MTLIKEPRTSCEISLDVTRDKSVGKKSPLWLILRKSHAWRNVDVNQQETVGKCSDLHLPLCVCECVVVCAWVCVCVCGCVVDVEVTQK